MKIHSLDFEKKFPVEQKAAYPEEQKVKVKMNKSNLVLIFVILALAGVLGWVVFKPEISWPWSKETVLSPLSDKKSSKKSRYQAVFLTNGQIYFGQLSGFPGNSPVLKDVYYLRVQRSLQPSDGLTEELEVEDKKKDKEKEETKVVPATDETPELTLIKLGNELHGPMDEIQLNSDHILFVEDLKQESRIVRAIEQFKTKI